MELSRHKEIAAERRKKIGSAAFDYDYQAATGLDVKVDLTPGSAFHDKLVNKALEMAHKSTEGQSTFLDKCRSMDWTKTGYVTPEDANPNGNPKNRQRSIVVPLSFELGNYFRAASKGTFIKDPIFRWKPKGGQKSLMAAHIWEYLIQQQMGWTYGGSTNRMACMTMWNSMYTYGISTGATSWQRKFGSKAVSREVTMTAVNMARAMGHDIPDSAINTYIRDADRQVMYEGTELVPWDVYSTLRDPNVTSNDVQRGEFIGNRRRTNANQIVSFERDKQMRRFNGQYVKALAESGDTTTSCFDSKRSGRGDRFGTEAHTAASAGTGDVLQPVDVLYFEVKLIPKDWECGEEIYPVVYMLELSADAIITAFGPTHSMDEEFNVVQGAPNTDGFDIIPVGHLFVTYGIQQFQDTMARVTEALALKNVNGGWTLFNHNVANWDDAQNPEPAKMIRYANPFVTPEQAKTAIQQFQSQDPRDSHMRHMSYFDQIARRGMGQFDATADLPDRPTTLGMKAATSDKINTIEMINWIIGEQHMTPLGWKMANNQIQNGIEPIQMEMVGRLVDRIMEEIGADPATADEVRHMFNPDGTINPMALDLPHEMEPYTGASGQNDDIAAQGQLITAGMQIPEVAAEMMQGLGWSGIMRDYVRNLGFPSVSEYKAAGNQIPQMITAPDEQVQANIASGNRVPVGG
jgi:hypothetical protein